MQQLMQAVFSGTHFQYDVHTTYWVTTQKSHNSLVADLITRAGNHLERKRNISISLKEPWITFQACKNKESQMLIDVRITAAEYLLGVTPRV